MTQVKCVILVQFDGFWIVAVYGDGKIVIKFACPFFAFYVWRNIKCVDYIILMGFII